MWQGYLLCTLYISMSVYSGSHGVYMLCLLSNMYDTCEASCPGQAVVHLLFLHKACTYQASWLTNMLHTYLLCWRPLCAPTSWHLLCWRLLSEILWSGFEVICFDQALFALSIWIRDFHRPGEVTSVLSAFVTSHHVQYFLTDSEINNAQVPKVVTAYCDKYFRDCATLKMLHSLF